MNVGDRVEYLPSMARTASNQRGTVEAIDGASITVRLDNGTVATSHVANLTNLTEPYMTHFAQDNKSQHTLCGQRWVSIVWGNDPRATCRVCQDEHAAKTGWSFPLPETVTTS